MIKKHWGVALLMALAFNTMPAPNSSAAQTASEPIWHSQIIATSLLPDVLPEIKLSGPAKITVTVTAYSSTSDQTDATPFITASGKRVRDGIAAANFLKFGTKIRIPELFGDKIFTVEDRMDKRFYHRIDIWFSTREAAFKFGKRTAEIEIL